MTPVARERGSVPLAMLISVVVAGIITTTVASTVAGQRATRFDKSFTSAVHVAEAGVQQALYLLDENRLTVGTATGTVNGSTYSYTAAQSGMRWTITSTGTVGTTTRTVQVTTDRPRRFPSPLYAEVKMHLTGSGCVKSYNSATGDPYNPCPSTTGNGVARSGGSLQGAGMSFDDSLSNAPLNLASAENMKFITDALAACGSLSDWTASVHGTAISSGTRCYNNMTFDRNTTVSPTAVIYVQGTVTFAPRVTVTCPTCGTSTKPNATGLQIYSAGTKVLFGKNNLVVGAIYAPRAACEGNPAMPGTTIYGSLICNTIKTNGQFYIHFDDQISNIGGGPPKVLGWTEL